MLLQQPSARPSHKQTSRSPGSDPVDTVECVEDRPPAELRGVLLRREFLPLAIKHTTESLEAAKSLYAAGFPSPAFVWAVRSAEIFFREALLFPLEYERTGDVAEAFAAARELFGSGKWERSLRRVRESYGLTGPDHDAVLESGEDAWDYWRREGVGVRGDVVHGRAEAEPERAEWAIAFVEQMRTWFALRVMTADAGPFAGVFIDIIEQARAIYERERERGSDALDD